MATPIETSQPPVIEPEPPAPEVQVDLDQAYPGNGNGNGGMKPAVNNLKPSIISEGFEFIGEIRSNGYLTIDGTVRGTLSLHSIQIGVTGVLDGNVTCDTMNVKGNFAGSLDCRDLTIGSRAVVDGKVSFKSITIQRGGVVKGELKKKP
ncbi:MAG: polymer-forming cytoskeletal protein [Betaproteobacteria bacterium]